MPRFEGIANELSPVVRDNLLWYSELSNYVFPHKFQDFSSGNDDQGFCFYPFGDVVLVATISWNFFGAIGEGLMMLILH